MTGSFCLLYPLLLHVKPVNAAASRASSSPLKQLINFLRELVRQRDIKVVQVPSEFQHADILTNFDLFVFHRKFLMKLKQDPRKMIGR